MYIPVSNATARRWDQSKCGVRIFIPERSLILDVAERLDEPVLIQLIYIYRIMQATIPF